MYLFAKSFNKPVLGNISQNRLETSLCTMADVVYDYSYCKDFKVSQMDRIYKRSEKKKQKSGDIQLLQHFS